MIATIFLTAVWLGMYVFVDIQLLGCTVVGIDTREFEQGLLKRINAIPCGMGSGLGPAVRSVYLEETAAESVAERLLRFGFGARPSVPGKTNASRHSTEMITTYKTSLKLVIFNVTHGLTIASDGSLSLFSRVFCSCLSLGRTGNMADSSPIPTLTLPAGYAIQLDIPPSRTISIFAKHPA